MENTHSPVSYVGYTRVSKLDQVVNGVSLEAQEARIRAWGTQRGAVEIGMFTDAGISGKSTEGRPGLADALRVARQNHAALVVYSLSRLARSTKDALRLVDELDKAKANLVSLTEQIDTTNGMGRFFFTIMAGVATLERDICSERTKMAMAYKRSNHERTSQRIPYGWDFNGDKQLVANPAEQEVLARIKTWRASGKSLRWICNTLEEAEVQTKLGKLTWRPTTVARLLEVM